MFGLRGRRRARPESRRVGDYLMHERLSLEEAWEKVERIHRLGGPLSSADVPWECPICATTGTVHVHDEDPVALYCEACGHSWAPRMGPIPPHLRDFLRTDMADRAARDVGSTG